MLSKLTQDSYSYWIGLYQNTHDSGFTWKDGTALDYENWNDYEPNNSGGMEGCVTVDKWSGKLVEEEIIDQNSCSRSTKFQAVAGTTTTAPS